MSVNEQCWLDTHPLPHPRRSPLSETKTLRTGGQCEISIPPTEFAEGGGGVYNKSDVTVIQSTQKYMDDFMMHDQYLRSWTDVGQRSAPWVKISADDI